MTNRMDEGYFEEKRDAAVATLLDAAQRLVSTADCIRTFGYAKPELVNPADIHSELDAANSEVKAARQYFEVARWATAKTDIDFDAWSRNERIRS